MRFIVSSHIYKLLLKEPKFVRFDTFVGLTDTGDGRKKGELGDIDVLVEPSKPDSYIEVVE